MDLIVLVQDKSEYVGELKRIAIVTSDSIDQETVCPYTEVGCLI